MTPLQTRSILALVAFGLVSCVTREEIEELKSNQKEILNKLEGLEKRGGGRPQAAAPRPQPGRPDPNKVYAFPVGDSPVKGPDDAWVTVIEVSDFQ